MYRIAAAIGALALIALGEFLERKGATNADVSERSNRRPVGHGSGGAHAPGQPDRRGVEDARVVNDALACGDGDGGGDAGGGQQDPGACVPGTGVTA